jgi:hypothetical protein
LRAADALAKEKKFLLDLPETRESPIWPKESKEKAIYLICLVLA